MSAVRFKRFTLNICAFVVMLLANKLHYAQTPAHYILGKTQFENTDIYSILYTTRGELYVSSNNGLFLFQYGKFQNIPFEDPTTGKSLFNLKENQKGEIFCCDLTGKIFKVQNNTLKLYHQFRAEDVYNLADFEFDNENQLVFASKRCLLLTSNGEQILSDTVKANICTISKLPSGKIVISSRDQHSFYVWDGKSLEKKRVSIGTEDSEYLPDYFKYFELNNHIFSLQGPDLVNPGKFWKAPVFVNKNDGYMHQINVNELWVRNKTMGVQKLMYSGENLASSPVWFPDLFISAVARGPNKSLFMGTFGNGVICIPNQQVLQHHLPPLKGLRTLCVAADNQILVNQLGKGIWHYNSKTNTTKKLVQGNFPNVFYVNGKNFGISSEFPGFYADVPERDFSPSVKDMYPVDSTTILIASAWGVHKQGPSNISPDIEWHSTPFKNLPMKRLKIKDARYNQILSDTANGHIYLSGPNNTFIVLNTNIDTLTELTYQKQPFVSRDFLQFNQEIWCATTDHGILIFENGKFKRKLGSPFGVLDHVSKLLSGPVNIYILTNDGLYICDKQSQKIRKAGIEQGFVGFINDFDLSNDQLWFITNKEKLYSIELDQFRNFPGPPAAVRIDSVLFGTKVYPAQSSYTLEHDQGHVKIHFSPQNFHSLQESKFYYRINASDTLYSEVGYPFEPVEFKSLSSGNYTFEYFIINGNEQSENQRFQFEIQRPLWLSWKYLSIYALLLAILFFIVIRLIINRINRKNQRKLENQRLKTDLLESELKALRSQMNPHFIFNSLNSIQDLVLREDTDASYDYIVLFADLVRNTLNYSNQDFIPIEKELEFLDIYLQLEKLRFGDEFEYRINYSGEKHNILVPSLLVQPFIENALVHGLLHKAGLKTLDITFEFTDALYCTVVDNGVGRQKSEEIQSRRGGKHQSFALEAIQKRIELLQNQSSAEVGYKITDLSENNEPTGTKVEISIPFQRKF